MKTKNVWMIAAVAVLLASCSESRQLSYEESDDVYEQSSGSVETYSSTDSKSPENYVSKPANKEYNVEDYYDENYAEEHNRQTTTTTDADGNTYITNNYYDDVDYYDYDYRYSSRIRRFYGPSYSYGYYDPWYTNSYWYNYDPYFYGVSIYNRPWNYGYGYGNCWGNWGWSLSWGWGNYGWYNSPYYGGWGGGWGNPYYPYGGYAWGGYGGYGYPYGYGYGYNNYWNGYNNGYWNGYNNGFYDANNGYGYNNNFYWGHREDMTASSYNPATANTNGNTLGSYNLGNSFSDNLAVNNGPVNGQTSLNFNDSYKPGGMLTSSTGNINSSVSSTPVVTSGKPENTVLSGNVKDNNTGFNPANTGTKPAMNTTTPVSTKPSNVSAWSNGRVDHVTPIDNNGMKPNAERPVNNTKPHYNSNESRPHENYYENNNSTRPHYENTTRPHENENSTRPNNNHYENNNESRPSNNNNSTRPNNNSRPREDNSTRPSNNNSNYNKPRDTGSSSRGNGSTFNGGNNSGSRSSGGNSGSRSSGGRGR